MADSTLVAEPLASTDPVPQRDCSAPASRRSALRYWVAVFLSAFLLFQVQLIVGKYILPLFGGAPAVWNTCMLCFQVLLLAGYSYAHILRLKFNPKAQGRIHSALLLFAVVVVAVLWAVWGSPLTPGVSWRPSPEDSPVWKILQLLLATVALPFFVLSATGPLLQNWYRYEGDGNSPYRLYAISNAGSLLGLLSYPFLIEWAFTIRHQAWVWAVGFAGFAILCAATGWRLTNRSDASLAASDDEAKVEEKPRASQYALWIGLSACSTTMLLAATNLICQDMAVIPLLWVVPLCIYLGTFILAFGKRRWYRRSIFWPLYFLALGVELKTNLFGHHLQSVLEIILLGIALFVVCMVCHGELSLSRPAPRHLTSFYLMVAGGGVAGGIFVVLIAPQWFVGFWEYQVALVACGLLLFAAYRLSDPSGQTEKSVWTLALLIEATFLITNIPDVFPALGNIQLLARPEVVGAAVGLIGATIWLLLKRRKSSPRSDDIPVAVDRGCRTHRDIRGAGLRLCSPPSLGGVVPRAQFLWDQERCERERTHCAAQRKHTAWTAIQDGRRARRAVNVLPQREWNRFAADELSAWEFRKFTRGSCWDGRGHFGGLWTPRGLLSFLRDRSGDGRSIGRQSVLFFVRARFESENRCGIGRRAGFP